MRSGVVLGLVLLATVQPIRAEKRSERVLQLGTHEGVPWPFINAPIDGDLPDAPRTDAILPPATKAAARVIAMLDGIGTSMTDTKYQASVGSSRVDLQACKLEYSIVSPK